MAERTDADTPTLLDHVLVPVANEEDARATARELRPYDPDRITAVHVVEKGGGVPDKVPLEQAEAMAEESFAAVRTEFPAVEEQLIFERDVVQAIFDVATEVNASTIAYRTRGGNRISRFLSGDRSLKLVTQSPVPVVVLPRNGSGRE